MEQRKEVAVVNEQEQAIIPQINAGIRVAFLIQQTGHIVE